MNVKDIRDWKKHYTDVLYNLTRAEQRKDLEYINDTFTPRTIREPHEVLRLGLGYEIVNSPAEQIVTSNPQAFIDVSKGSKDAGSRISELINQRWVYILSRQNPNPFKQTVTNKLARGESYIKVVHNEAWVTGETNRVGLPVIFQTLDSMVVFASPEEDENGIPERVVVFYDRQPNDVIVRYPDWTNPKKAGIGDNIGAKVQWFEYWDKKVRYFEADEEAVLLGEGGKMGIQENIYKIVPFVRKYSGFGSRSPDGELSNLIYSDIRNSRGLIEEICIMRSDIASVMHLSAHKPILVTSEGKLNLDDLRQNLVTGAYDLTVLENLPQNTKIETGGLIDPPTLEAFRHTADIMANLTRRHPYIMAGFPMGTSGRQQGMTDVSAMRRYDTVIENTENEWATAFEMAFKIMRTVPTLVPDGLRKSDLDVAFKCQVKLKAKDPIEEDRLITLGDRLRRQPDPAINLQTFHTDFMGYTPEESKQIQAQIMADNVTIYNPDWAEVAGMIAAEEGGMEQWLERVRERRQQMEQGGLKQPPPKTTQQRQQGETQTESGREIGTEGTRGARQSPDRFTR